MGASEFGAKIPPGGALAHIPTPRRRSTGPVALSPTATPPGSAALPRRSVASSDERPARTAPKVGGTQILPEGGLLPEGPSNDSTFRRSASELTLDPQPDHPSPKRSRTGLAVAIGGLAIAGVAAVFLTQNNPVRHRTAPPVAAEPEAAPPVPPQAPAPAPTAPGPKEELPARPPAKATIRIVSRPAGAELWLGDESTPRGETPLNLVVPRNASGLRATLKHDGFEEAHLSINPSHAGPLQVELEKVKTAHHHTPPAQAHHPKHEAETTPGAPKKPAEGFFGVGD